MKIIFATNNKHKLKEVQAVLGDGYRLVTPSELGITEEIPEDRPTIEGNASQKSHYLYERTGADCFADDTGLEVEALGGEPGVRSARYAGPGHDSERNMELLLRNMEGITDRRARFRTVISLILDGEEHLFEGIVGGVLLTVPPRHERLRIRPIFVPDRVCGNFRRNERRSQERDQSPGTRRRKAGRLPQQPSLMRTYKARGIVLHTIKYGDSSAIAYLFTDVLGRMSYMVQGIRSKRGRGNKAALLQPMFLVEFEGVEQPHAQMHRVREMRQSPPADVGPVRCAQKHDLDVHGRGAVPADPRGRGQQAPVRLSLRGRAEARRDAGGNR